MAKAEMNRKHSRKFWRLVDQTGQGEDFTPGCDREKKQHYFLAVFPLDQLTLIKNMTTDELERNGLAGTTIGKILKRCGVVLLTTRFQVGSRASLWANKGIRRLVPPSDFGETTCTARQ